MTTKRRRARYRPTGNQRGRLRAFEIIVSLAARFEVGCWVAAAGDAGWGPPGSLAYAFKPLTLDGTDFHGWFVRWYETFYGTRVEAAAAFLEALGRYRAKDYRLRQGTFLRVADDELEQVGVWAEPE